ncbi:MAG: S-layer homology domain-containing protein [Thermoleophilia bacterium]|nr:S-layer homology domain-containing protein [Thermoleophilia bacterium]
METERRPQVWLTILVVGLALFVSGLFAAGGSPPAAAGGASGSAEGAGLRVAAGVEAAAASLSWVRTGGPIGGLGYDVRMRPDRPDTMLVTDAYAGVFRSTDGGLTWQPSNTGITVRTGPSGDSIPVFCLTIDPHDNDIVWAGTQYLRGIFRSLDGGKTWTKRDNGVVEANGITFRGFTVDPRSSNIVYAAAELSSWQWNPGGTDKPGREFDLTKGVVYKTVDGGANWQAVWRGDNLARYIWIDPINPETVYVSTGIFDREAANSNPNDAAKATPGGAGVVKSTDGGLTWGPANNGLGNLYVGSLFMHPDNPQILLAGTGNNQYMDQAGVYLSTNGGASWTRTLANDVITSVEFSEADPRIAYAGSLGHVYRSEDGGLTWQNVTGPQWIWGPPGVAAGFPIDFQVDPRNAWRIFANNYGGGNFLSIDGGATWSIASKGYTGAQSRDIAVDPVEAGRVITACRSGIFKTLNGGSDWIGIGAPPMTFIEWNAVAIDPTDGRHILAATNQTSHLVESRDGGQSWVVRGPNLGNALAFRAFAFAPSDPKTVYAGTGAYSSAGQYNGELAGKGVYVSHDGGATWNPANDGNSASVQAANIAVHPTNPRIVYAAAVKAGLLRTTDGGGSWTKLQGPWPATTPVMSVALSPADPQMVFAGTGAGLFRTPDGGGTWQQLMSGFNPESYFTSIVADPTDPQVMYVGDLAGGVYRTENGGGLWTPINQGLRTKAVNRLAISSDGDHLYAATEGEGVFRLDLAGSPPPKATEPQQGFDDVPATHPYYVQINAVAGQGIVGGYGDGRFGPDNLVTRQQFAKMIVRTLGLPVTGAEVSHFTDVATNLDPNDPFYPDKYVAVCAAHGITTGKTETTFAPYADMTRAQLITMVARAAELPDPPPEYIPPFGEFSPVHYPWARKAAWAELTNGLMGMGPDFPFLGPAKRGEVCVLLYNLLHRR